MWLMQNQKNKIKPMLHVYVHEFSISTIKHLRLREATNGAVLSDKPIVATVLVQTRIIIPVKKIAT